MLAVGALLALTLSGCALSVDDPANVEPEITVVLESSTASLNPYAPAIAQRRIGRLVFQGLMSIDEKGDPIADLVTEVPTVENGGISADGKTIRYKLGESSFHDGTPVTAEDVVFTIEKLSSGELVDEPGVNLGSIRAVRAVDGRTVELQLHEPDTRLVWRLAPFVLPAHLLAQSPDLLSDPFWLQPVGSGPYRVSDVRPGASIRLIRTLDDGGPSSLDVAFVPSESAGRTVFDDAPYAVWVDTSVGAAGSNESRSTTESAAWWRLASSATAGSIASDPAVRRAVRAVVESQWATDTVQAGTGPYGYEIQARPSEITTAQIATELAEAGWAVSEDGIRAKGGMPLEVVLRTPALDLGDAASADRVKAAAVDVGMLLEVRPSGPDFYADYLEGGVLARLEGDFFLTCVAVGAPAGYAWPFHPDEVPSFDRPSGLNWQRMTGDSARRWTERVKSAGTPEEAEAVLRSAWAELDESDMLAWLYPSEHSVLAKGVTGVSAHPFAEMALTGASKWRLAE